MEHAVVLLILHGIQALDRASQRPLPRTIPEAAKLRQNPAAYFAEHEVRIGPRIPFGSAGAVGILCAALVFLVLTLGAINQPLGRRFADRFTGILISTTVTFLATTALAARLLRGGRMTLRADGATLQFRGRVTHLPWDLFAVPGAVFKPDEHRVVIPVYELASPWVLKSGGEWQEVPVATLKVPGLRGTADGQLVMRNLFNVPPDELAGLLMEIGQKVSKLKLPPEVAVALAGPAAIPGVEDWTIRLTRLPLPPICLGCGQPTEKTTEQRLNDGNKTVKVSLPVCPRCLVESWPTGTRIGVGIAGVAALPLMVCAGLIPGLPLGMIVVFVMFGCVLGVSLLYAAFKSPKGPVSLSNYSIQTGTVKMKLLKPEGEAALRRALGYVGSVADEPDNG